MIKNPDKMWRLYILKCADDSLYTGITTDISRRVKEHNSKKGGKYTRVRVPVKLVYKEKCENKSKALKREIQIKNWTRQEKLEFIKANK